MRRTSAWQVAGLLLAVACVDASVAQAQQCIGPGSMPRPPANAANGSYTSDYITCSTNGFTARAWLNQFQLLAGWKRIEGRRSNACAGLPGVVGYLSVVGEFLNFSNGAKGLGFRFAPSPLGCTSNTTIGYTITNPDRWFFNRGCSIYYGNCSQSVGAGEIEFFEP